MSKSNREGFKAYAPGLVCRGKQYAEDTTFEEDGGAICRAGMMHYCTNPLDCLDYYPLVRSDGQLSDFTTVTASGDAAKLAASGEDSVVAGIGIGNKAKAALGCWIVLAEWVWCPEKDRYIPVNVKAAKVDGETIKPDTTYQLIDGEFQEVRE